MLDLTTEFGARVARRLHKEQIIWLTTVRADLTPQPSPVWFFWDDATFLVYSRPNTPKLRNIAHTSKVALHLNSDEQGGDIVVITGEAQIDEHAPPAQARAAYIEKYRDSISRLGMTPEGFGQDYAVALRVRPIRVRGY